MPQDPAERLTTPLLVAAAALLLFAPTTTVALEPGDATGHVHEHASEQHETPPLADDPLPQAANGFTLHTLAAATAPTNLAFSPDGDLYATLLTGSIVQWELAWTDLGPIVEDQETMVEGLSSPLGLDLDDQGTVYVSENYAHDVADRDVSKITAIDLDTGERTLLVDGLPSGQHHANQIAFGPDGNLFIPLGNPNDSGNGTGSGETDIFPITGAFLNVTTQQLFDEGPAVLHYEDEEGPIEPDDLLDHPDNQDFVDKVTVFAHGFRNIFGIAWANEALQPGFAGEAYTGTNGADNPNSQDTFYRINEDRNHGYPFCVSQGSPGQTDGIIKTTWEGSPNPDVPCDDKPPADALLGWHTCATGLDLPAPAQDGYPDYTFPKWAQTSAFLAECGPFQAGNILEETQNEPTHRNTGHKIVQITLDEDEGLPTSVGDFVTGLTLPTDAHFGPDGALYVADADKILRIAPLPAGLSDELADLASALNDASIPVQALGAQFLPQVTLATVDATVTWEGDLLGHTVTTSDKLCTPATLEACTPNEDEADPNTVNKGLPSFGTVQHTFTDPGIYPYYCQPHHQMGMNGIVVVVDPDDPRPFTLDDLLDVIP